MCDHNLEISRELEKLEWRPTILDLALFDCEISVATNYAQINDLDVMHQLFNFLQVSFEVFG